MKGTTKNYDTKSYGSLDDTVILIEADESTPLLVDRRLSLGSFIGRYNNDNEYGKEKSLFFFDYSVWSLASKSSVSSTKSFKSHFWELKVLAIVLLFAAAIGIAIYLLIVETRLPSITFSLDLVHHDVWSIKKLPMGPRMDPLNVDSVMITQTGSNNCDNPIQCQNILQQMQSDYSNRLKQELPYNFLIGCDGVAYEVRGWTYESGMEGVDQKRTLVIGLIGNFDYTSPPHVLIKTLKFLMKESVKRRKLKRFHQVHNLNKFCTDCVEDTLIQ